MGAMDHAHVESCALAEQGRVRIGFDGLFYHVLIHGQNSHPIFTNKAHGTYRIPAIVSLGPNLLPMVVELYRRDCAVGLHGDHELTQPAELVFVTVENEGGPLWLEKIFARDRCFGEAHLSGAPFCLIFEEGHLASHIGQRGAWGSEDPVPERYLSYRQGTEQKGIMTIHTRLDLHNGATLM